MLRMPSKGATKTWLRLRIAGHEGVGLARVEQEQDDARPDEDLDEPEHEDDDAPGELASRRVRVLVVRRLSVRTVSWPAGVSGCLGDDRPVDLIDGHDFLRVPPGIRGSGAS